MTPYYEQDGITIYHGDCRDILPSMPSADAMITDPPYGTNVTTWDDPIEAEIFQLCIEKTSGYAVFFYSNTRLGQILGALKAAGADTWVAVWHKPNSVGFERKFAPQWTPIVIAYQKPLKFWGKDLCYCPIIPYKQMEHPTPKPLTVTAWCVEKATEIGDVVLDPFMGSGTVLRAAKDLGRRAIGIEINERYCEIAAERLQQRVLPFAESP